MSQPRNSGQVRSTYITPAFHLSYPALFEAVAVMGDETKKKFGITMLFPKKVKVAEYQKATHPAARYMIDDNCKGFWQEIERIARANFGPEVDLRTLKLTKFRDGDKPKTNGKIDDNEKGFIVVRSSTNERPDCLRGDKTRVTDASELYPGCWCRAVLTVAMFPRTAKSPMPGVTVYLNGVQKLADDTPFSSRPRAEDAFDAVAESSPADASTPVSAAAEEKQPWDV